MKTVIDYNYGEKHLEFLETLNRTETYILINPVYSVYDIRMKGKETPIATCNQLVNAKRILFLMEKWNGDLEMLQEEN